MRGSLAKKLRKEAQRISVTKPNVEYVKTKNRYIDENGEVVRITEGTRTLTDDCTRGLYQRLKKVI